MKLIDRIQGATSTLFTFEILPPRKGDGIKDLFVTIERLLEFRPAVIDVTTHRQDYVRITDRHGNQEWKPYCKRPGTVGICAAILNRYGIDPVPHIICGGATKERIEEALIDLHYLGITNILVLQGDKLSIEDEFIATPGGHGYANGLLQQATAMNQGRYLDPDIQLKEPSDFCIGVAGYPEKHYAAPDMAADLRFLKAKVDAGADYIVTQMFFDNAKYFSFVESCRALGITVPIIPGIKPLTNARHLATLPAIFFTEIPEILAQEVKRASDPAAVQQIGIEWCIQQCRELLKCRVPSLHFYTMSRPHPTLKILREIF